MITANELRIGNWVMYNDQNETPMPTAIQICIQDLILINENVKDCNYNPIPLTEQILLKCGLIDTKYTLYIKAKTKVIIFNWSSKVVATGVRYGWHCKKYKHIKYLHELQNLYYALTKTELIINL